ncbi:MAG: hypothetical protein ACTS45_01565 [Candidatus Hodgkinia cicadicola]
MLQIATTKVDEFNARMNLTLNQNFSKITNYIKTLPKWINIFLTTDWTNLTDRNHYDAIPLLASLWLFFEFCQVIKCNEMNVFAYIRTGV